MDNTDQAVVVKAGSTPANVIEYAIKSNAPIEQLEKLLTLQERYDANEAKKAYNVAMAAFKVKPPEIDKDRDVKYNNVKYSHASLYNVTTKINAELSKHGLSASWQTKQNGVIMITCKITHIQGHSEETTLSAPADSSGSKNDIQAIGSTITYLQRYTLLAMTGLATHDGDNDAQDEVVECINEKELEQINALIKEKGVLLNQFCPAFAIESVDKLPKKTFNQAMAMLKARAKS